jgi:hypothetical protein
VGPCLSLPHAWATSLLSLRSVCELPLPNKNLGTQEVFKETLLLQPLRLGLSAERLRRCTGYVIGLVKKKMLQIFAPKLPFPMAAMAEDDSAWASYLFSPGAQVHGARRESTMGNQRALLVLGSDWPSPGLLARCRGRGAGGQRRRPKRDIAARVASWRGDSGGLVLFRSGRRARGENVGPEPTRGRGRRIKELAPEAELAELHGAQ